MPKIKIYESDLTTAGGLNASSNVVYIPGAVKGYEITKNGISETIPKTGTYRFNTVAEFKDAFKNPTTGKFEYLKISRDDPVIDKVRYITIEKSQQYALAVLQAGLPIVFEVVATFKSPINDTEAETLIRDKFNSTLFEKLKDRNNYGDVKFITTGGYENYSDGLYNTMISAVSNSDLSGVPGRQDCVVLVDHEETSTYSAIKDLFKDTPPANGKYGAMFTPWCTFQFSSQEILEPNVKLDTINMPGSLAYLLAFATSIGNNNPNWLAAAGASRGIIPNLVAPLEYLTEAQIDTYALTNNNYQGVAINPIAQINPYGVIVWGNRTLHQGVQGLVASSFLNIRHLCSDIKKTIYTACKSITFEQNSDLLWIKFKSLITPLLDQMQTGEGIAGYELKRKKSTKKATLTAVIRIYPIEAVEDFEMTVELADEATSVME